MCRILLMVLALSVAALTGCSSLGCGDPHPYMNNPSLPPLKAPEGLSIPSPDPAYAVSGTAPNAGKSTERNTAGVCLINPPRVLPAAAMAKPAALTKEAAPAPVNTEPSVKPAGQNKTAAPNAGTVPTAPPVATTYITE